MNTDSAGENQVKEEDVRDDGEEEQDQEAEQMTYEEQRMATIRANEELLKSLGLVTTAPPIPRPQSTATASSSRETSVKPSGVFVPKRIVRKPPGEPLRKSSRLSAVARAKDDDSGKRGGKRPKLDRNASSLTPLSGNGSSGFESDTSSETSESRRRKSGRSVLPPGQKIRIPAVRSVEYADEAGEEDYDKVRPLPTREGGATGRLVFEGRWKGVFVPNLTPEEVYRGGAFGGSYYADTYSTILKQDLSASEDVSTLPQSWLRTGTDTPFSIATHLTAPVRDPSVNRYAVAAGQGLKEWEKSGWIWKGDPRGWMQWFVRFYNGRRCVDDERQVQRWLNLAGPTGRFSRALMKKIAQHPGSGGAVVDNTAVDDEDVGRVMRQVCWQWGLVMDRDEWRTRIEGGGGL